MKENEERAVKEFSSLLRKEIGMDLIEIKVFGSKVRGDDSPESDIDMLIILKQNDKKKKEIIANFSFEIGLKYDMFLSTIVYEQNEFYSPLSKETFFYQNIQKDGVLV